MNRYDQCFETGWPDLTNVAVETPAGREIVWDVRWQAYLRSGMRVRRGEVEDAVDQSRHAHLFYSLADGTPVGSVRVFVSSVEGERRPSPATAAFGDEIAANFRDRTYVEAGRLAVFTGDAPDLRRLMAVFQNVAAAADEHDCEFILAPTRADHTRFYAGMGFEEVAGPRRYLGFPYPGVLLALDWRRARRRLLAHRRYCHIFRPAWALAAPAVKDVAVAC